MNTNINIWVYIGVIGSGKDYNAKKKQEETGGVISGFSEGVREFTFDFLGWHPSSIEMYEKFKYHNFIIDYPNYSKVHDGRKFLENVGSKMRKYDCDFWASVWKRKCIELIKSGIKDIIISDCRYINEVNSILSLMDEFNIIPNFYFTNYKSERWELRKHESEFFAQYLLELGCKDSENITEKIIKIVNEQSC